MHRTVAIAGLVAIVSAAACHRSTQRAVPVGERSIAADHLDHAAIAAGRTDVASAIARGRALFAASFTTLDGAGRPNSTGTGGPRARREEPHNFNRISGPDANSCAGCHNLPDLGGGGDNVANVFVLGQRFPFLNFDGGEGDGFADHTLRQTANERNTLGMWGAGFIELLAREMTADLHASRERALAAAARDGAPTTALLEAKGVRFGSLVAHPDGRIDTSGVRGCDADLVIKPFHQKGVVASLRQFTNNAMNHHHGMQPSERFGAGIDADRDGVVDELSDGDITAITLFQATLRVPARVQPGSSGAELEAARRGEELFAAIGCAVCHVPALRLADSVFTEPGPYNPEGNLRAGEAPLVAVDLTRVGQAPRLAAEADGTVIVRAYTDLKRHDMGPALANELLEQDGVPTSVFLTKKLWGMASEPPFMHHGRALTLDEAITLHGGEGQAARDTYLALAAADRAAVLEFLATLQVPAAGAASTELVGSPSGTVGEAAAVAAHLDQRDLENGAVTVAAMLDHGARLFAASFNTLDGAGRPASTGTGGSRTPRTGFEAHNRISGPDANSCAGCHNLPRIGGGGDNVANVFVLAQRLPHVDFDGGEGDGFVHRTLLDVGNERNTLGMWGSGYVELLAREMTTELHRQRDALRAAAMRTGTATRAELTAKGVRFGHLTARADGNFDASEVQGIDADLVVKPFHQKGAVVSLRQFTNNALNHHHGIQSSERFGAGTDPDQDGKTDELTIGDVTALTLFQALLPVPVRARAADAGERAAVELGERLFTKVGCSDCHVPELPLDASVFSEPNPYNPPGNLQLAGVNAPIRVDLNLSGPAPRLAAGTDGKTRVPLYSDLKRHDLGPECDNERNRQDGIPTALFLTKKLWGAASEPPFMHHGRATTLAEAVAMHGGEAADSRAAFHRLTAGEQACVIDFLRSLRVAPE